MKWVARILAGSALAMGAAAWVRQVSPQSSEFASSATSGLMLPKMLGSALSPYVAAAGAAGAVLGAVSGSPTSVVIGTTGAALAAGHARRIESAPADFAAAFGPAWAQHIPTDAAIAPRRWTPRLPRVPEPRWTRDITYAEVPGARALLADVWEPGEGVARSGLAVVYVHGGAWYYMDKDVLTRPLFRQLTGQGHVVLDIAHRDCPEVDLSTMVCDVWRGVAWMRANAGRYGVRPDRIALVGGSSGAHLALLAAHAHDDPALTPPELRGADLRVAGVASWYGPVDLVSYSGQPAAQRAARQCPADPPGPPTAAMDRMLRLALGRTLTAEQMPPTPPHGQMMRDLIGGLPEDRPEAAAVVDVATHVRAGGPATLQCLGDADFVASADAARRLHAALKSVGVPSVLVVLPGAEHAFDLFYPPLANPAGRVALHDLECFLWLLR